MTTDIANFARDLGVTIVPPRQQRQRGPGDTCAQATIEELVSDWGVAHATLTLRAIVESERRDNALQLTRPVIMGVSDVLVAHPHWANLGLALLEAVDQVDLAAVWRRARATKVGTVRKALAALLADELNRLLPPPPPKPKKPKMARPACVDEATWQAIQAMRPPRRKGVRGPYKKCKAAGC